MSQEKFIHTMPKTLTCIGNACIDIIADCSTEDLERWQIPKSICTHYSTLNPIKTIRLQMREPRIIHGGAGANTAHALAALGASPHFISVVSGDADGLAFKSAMEESGVIPHIRQIGGDEDATCQVLGFNTPDGDRTYASYNGVAELIAREHIPFEVIHATDIFYIDGYTFGAHQAADLYQAVLSALTTHGGEACLNLGDKSLLDLHGGLIRSLLGHIAGFIGNRTEAETLLATTAATQEATTQNLARQCAAQFRFGAITDGAEGSWVFENGEIAHIPAIPLEPGRLIDSIGAGDHYSAGLLYGLAHGWPIRDAGQLATICASECLTHEGGRPLGGKNSLSHLVKSLKS